MAFFTVNTNSDVDDGLGDGDGVMSLRKAIRLAEDSIGGDTIDFDESVFAADGTIRLTSGTALQLTSNLTIDGDIDGDGDADITITGDQNGDDTIIEGGRGYDISDSAVDSYGDNTQVFRVEDSGTTVELTNLVVTGSKTSAILNYGDLTLTNTVISGNVSASGEGAGVASFGGMVTVEDSLFEGNVAQKGGAIYTTGGLNVQNTSFVGNTASESGGAVGVYVSDDVVTLDGSTFSGNAAATGGGLNIELGVMVAGTVEIVNATFADNVSSAGSTIFFEDAASGLISRSTFTGNTNNSDGTLGGEIAGLLVESSIVLGNENNLSATADSLFGEAVVDTNLTEGDVAGVFAKLSVDGTSGLLADNGGDVQTVALLASVDNPALDVVAGGGYDARGSYRATVIKPDVPADSDTTADIGAFELQAGDLLASGLTSDLIVNTADDVDIADIDFFDDVLTLREAIMIAGDGDTITFDSDVFSDANFAEETATINLKDFLRIENSITINGDTDGDGDSDVVVSGDTDGDDPRSASVLANAPILTDLGDAADLEDIESIAGLDNNTALFVIGDKDLTSHTVTLNGLVLTGGVGEVGGIYALNTDLSVTNTIIGGNAGGYGGGIIAVGGAITVRDSAITGNLASEAGGIAVLDASRFTMDLSDAGELVIQNSLISDNRASFGGGIVSQVQTDITGTTIRGNTAENGAGIVSTGGLTMTASLVADNIASENGGGLWLESEDNTFTNVTIAQNSASGTGGGIYVADVTAPSGLTATHVTITGNRNGGATNTGPDAISAVAQSGSGVITFDNSIIASNGIEGLYQVTIGGELAFETGSLGGANNIFGDVDIDTIFAVTGTTDGIKSGFLADNGGEVETIALLASADNIALDNAGDSGVTTDARGRTRSDFAGLGLGVADIGAFELINVAPVITTLSAQTVTEGETTIVDVDATDALVSEGAGLTYEIMGGADASAFAIDEATGALTLNDAPNFEAPIDADGDNVYEVTVIASDGTSSGSLNLSVSVTDLPEAVTLTGVPEGGTLTGSDEPDVITGAFGDDDVIGGLGDDLILDPGGDDTVDAGGGDDRVGLLSGMNTVSGGDGDDLIVGGFNSDDLSGDAGADVILGDVSTRLFGSDRINGGTGDDMLEGRGGADTFVFVVGDGNDTIGALNIDYAAPGSTVATGTDFVSGVDLIELSGFGLADADAALAKVTDVGGVATFSDQGTTITFTGLTADDLSADDFILA
jgi:predicted outer membrane repeat protein